MTYAGFLQVEPSQFTLKMERMVVRCDSIGIDCCGIVLGTRQPWRLETTAFRQPEGYFLANKQTQYEDDEYETSIYLLRAKSSVDECAIEGFWCEQMKGYDPEIWRFSGVLNPF